MMPTRSSPSALVGHEWLGLPDHLLNCAALRGRWFNLRCFAEALHALVATRFVTTVMVAALAAGVVSLAL